MTPPGAAIDLLATACESIDRLAVVVEPDAAGPTVRARSPAWIARFEGGAPAAAGPEPRLTLDAGGDALAGDAPFRGIARLPAPGPGGALALEFVPLRDRRSRRVAWLAYLPEAPGVRPRGEAAPGRAAVLEGLGHAVIVHRSYRPLYANAACVSKLGYESLAALLDVPTMLVHLPVERHVRALRYHREILDGREPAGPVWLRCFDAAGAPFWAESVAARIEWDGAPAEALSFSDATEHMESRGTERLLAEAVDSIDDSVVLYDAEERVVYSNRRFHELYPYLPAKDRIRGARMADLLHLFVLHGGVVDPGAREDPEGWVDRFIEQRRSTDGSIVENQHPDGRWHRVQQQHTRSGGFMSVRSDITERYRAELALRDSEARLEHELAERTAQLQAILENIAQGVTVVGPDHRVILANEGFARMYGLPIELTRRGTPVAEYVRFRVGQQRYREGESRDVDVAALIERRLAEYETLTREMTVDELVDGRLIEVRRERIPDGSIVSTHTDVTDRFRAERELQRQREALHQSEKLSALGTLLAGVAHELNNPLSVLVGQTVLLESEAPEAIRERARKARAAADRCARIVKTFLAMARQRPAVWAPTSVNSVVEQVLDLLAYQLRNADIDLRLDFDRALPDIEADADQLAQVVVNLVVNAQHALADSEPPYRLRIATRLAPGGAHVELEIADSGPGVPADARRRVFEPFYTTKAAGVGTGIGLALCHAMVESHDGRIDVHDAPEGGASFVVTLPVPSGEAKAEPVGSVPEGPAAPGRILVVDDEDDVRDYVADVLALDGHHVEQAANGAAALERIAHRGDYSALVCDLRMPVMDGPTFFSQLRETSPELAARVVFLTGDLLGGRAEAFLSSSGRPYVEKPVTPDQLRRAVREIVAKP